MSTNADEIVHFRDAHRPLLEAGDYKISVTQTVAIKNSTEEFNKVDEFNKVLDFSVAGERFVLRPEDIHAVYPPDGSRGDYSECLPHVVLNRDTLPWERSATDTVDGSPWLALLLLHEDELQVNGQKIKPQTDTVGSYINKLPQQKKN